MYRVDDPVLGWRWRAYPKGAHEARMQQLRENRDGKTPFMVEPETQSPAALHPPPRPSSPIVFTTSRPPLPPLPRPAGPVLPGIPTLTPLPTGVQLMATAAPRTAPNFMAQFAERCAAVRFAPLPWPSISFTEQFALSCRASLSLPLPWPVALSVALPPSAPLLAPPAPPAPVAPVASLPAATLPPLVLSAPFVPPATFHFVATAARHDRRPRLNPRRRATPLAPNPRATDSPCSAPCADSCCCPRSYCRRCSCASSSTNTNTSTSTSTSTTSSSSSSCAAALRSSRLLLLLRCHRLVPLVPLLRGRHLLARLRSPR
jgi:hypothetical protein